MKSIAELAKDLEGWAYGEGTVDLDELINACNMAAEHEIITHCSTCDKPIRTYSKIQKFCSLECKARAHRNPDYMRSYYLKKKRDVFSQMIKEN